MNRRGVQVAVVALIVAGTAMHIWLLRAPMGALDSDSAVPGLMALRVRHFEFPAFYWGQSYGGSLEFLLAGLAFLVVPVTGTATKVLAMAGAAGAAVVTWRIGLRFVGDRAAALGGALMWAFPAGLLWWSTKWGTYWGTLLVTLVAVLLLLRMLEAPDWPLVRRLAFGFAAGVAFWLNPQCLYLLLPVGVAFAPRLIRGWSKLLPVALAGAVGAAPWLAYNAQHHLASLHGAKQPAVPNSYVDHLRGFVHLGLPMTLGLRRPFDTRWVAQPWGKVFYVLAVAGFVALFVYAVMRKRRYLAVCIAAVGFPLAYALSPYGWFTVTPRYMTFLLPTSSLLLGLLLSRRWLWLPGVALVLALSVSGLQYLNTGHGLVVAPYAPDVPVPASLASLEVLAHQHHIKYAYSHYWIAYRLTLETREHVICTPTVAGRFRHYDAVVGQHAATADAWYVFLRGSSWLRNFDAAMRARATPVERFSRGAFIVIRPLSPVRASDLASVWAT